MNKLEQPPEQTFPCREPGCLESVGYRYKPLMPGVFRPQKDSLVGDGAIIKVYLTCHDNHCYPYRAVR